MRMLSYDIARHLMLALEKPVVYVVYDLETTGFDRDNDRIIQFFGKKVIFDGDDGFIMTDSLNLLINPGFSLPENIVSLTGITDEMLLDKPNESDVFRTIKDFMEGCIPVGFCNRRFDDEMLDSMFRRCSGESFTFDYEIDVYDIAKVLIMDGETSNRKLKTYVTELNIVGPDHSFHDASADVDATEKLLSYLIPLARKHVEKIIPLLVKNKVKRLKYFENRSLSRDASKDNCIYIATDNGDFKYMEKDETKKWQCTTSDRIERYDIDDMAHQCMAMAGADNMDDVFTAVKEAGGMIYPVAEFV